MKEEKHSYIKGLLHGIGTLLTGMKFYSLRCNIFSPFFQFFCIFIFFVLQLLLGNLEE